VAKRETVADKLQRKLEEQRTADTLGVTEDKGAGPEPLEEADILKPADTADQPQTSPKHVSSGPESSVIAEEKDYGKVFEQYDRPIVEQALADALKNPRVAAWSPTSAMILNYFKSTRPRSGKSLSSEIDEILTAGLIKRYPELYQAFQIVISETSLEITNLKGIK
jgi:hypothetical protein